MLGSGIRTQESFPSCASLNNRPQSQAVQHWFPFRISSRLRSTVHKACAGDRLRASRISGCSTAAATAIGRAKSVQRTKRLVSCRSEDLGRWPITRVGPAVERGRCRGSRVMLVERSMLIKRSISSRGASVRLQLLLFAEREHLDLMINENRNNVFNALRYGRAYHILEA